MIVSRRNLWPVFLLLSASAVADVTYVVNGVNDEIEQNVLSHVDTLQFGPQIRLSRRDLEKVQTTAIENARLALRPFGYYAPEITTRVRERDGRPPAVEINIDPGPPLRIADVNVGVTGSGANQEQFRSWQRRWPLETGDVLNQIEWEAQKQEVQEIATSRGFHSAKFTEQALEIDLENNTANVRLILETGPRFVMGEVEFGEHVLKPGILEYIPRFEKGDPYSAILVSRLRTDLWQTGYFTDVQVAEVRRPELSPPVVDLRVDVETKTRNRYQGALGWGTDTGARLQANWTRQPISSYGDRLDLGIGWQRLDDEFRLRGTYHLPRRNRARQFWTTDVTLRFENLDLKVKLDEEDEESIQIGRGDVDEQHLRFGRLKVRNFDSGDQQLFETLFVQHINSSRKFEVGEDSPEFIQLLDDPGFDNLIKGTDRATSLGVDLDLVAVEGKGFETSGRRDRAWIFHSNEAFGSELEFTQLYLSSRRIYLQGERLKYHLRAEVGYTEADVEDFTIESGGNEIDLSVTRLPNFYRFKAGGSQSVRGYGFERLSNNDIGSNHIITASAEVEYRIFDRWSVATFFDIGNAFNDWSDPDLKRGVGVGVRWYSIAGEVRLDVASALDFEDDPWRVHFTIGTPLL